MTENIVTGKKYRILTDATQDIWDRISFWTKASDVYYDDNSNAEANRPIGILKRGTAYVVGTVAYEITAPSWVMLKCTTAGTTAASTPSTYKTISSSGTVITDGTAKFTVYDIRPTTTLSTNAYSVPTVSLLNTQISNLSPKEVSSTSGYTINQNVCYTLGKLVNLSVGVLAPAGYNAGNYLNIAQAPVAPKKETIGTALVLYGTYTFATAVKITTNGKIHILTLSQVFQIAGNNNCDISFDICYVSA